MNDLNYIAPFRSVLSEQSKDGSLATYSSELHLVSVTEKDSGYYQCKASHQFSSVQSKMARITVLGKCSWSNVSWLYENYKQKRKTLEW